MEKTSVCLICLIGLPASGKSTLAKKIQTKFKSKFDVEIIIFDKEISWNEVKSWKNKRIDVRELVIGRIQDSLKLLNRKTLIILDDNMFYRSMRYEYYQLARRFSIGFCEIYLNTNLEICLKLNKERIDPVNENTIINMSTKLDKPDLNFFKWEKNNIILTQNLIDSDWKNVENMINQCFHEPVEESNQKTEVTTFSHNVLHSADIVLRKIVNELIRNQIQTNGISETYCRELANKRRIIFERIRAGDIVLPEINTENRVQIYSEILHSEFVHLQ